MSTLREISIILLLSSNLILLTEVIADSSPRSCLWKRSYRMQVFANSSSTYYPIPARSKLECLLMCQRKPVCDNVCFNISSNSCFADTHIMTSSSDIASPEVPCFFRVGSCSSTRGYSLVNGRCMKIHDTPPVWTDYNVAAATCSGEGGHLFDMLTSQDRDSLHEYLGQQTGLLPQYLYLGARKSTGDFFWTDGSLMSNSSSFWDSGQPNFISENCVAISKSNFKLHDIGCYPSIPAFVCQIDV